MTDKQNTEAVRKDKGSDIVADLPILGQLTYDEIHAAELGAGIGVGAVAAILYSHYYGDGTIAKTAVVAVIGFYSMALGIRKASKNPPKGLKTAKKEPWYSMTATAVLGSLAFAVGLALQLHL